MRIKVTATHVVAGLLGGAVMAMAPVAAAGPCPTDSSVVHVSGSSAFKNVLQAVQTVLGTKAQIVYQTPGSCQGLQDVIGDGAGPIKDASAALLLNPDKSMSTTCDASGPFSIDIGISDVYRDVCAATYDTALAPLGANQKDFLGPIQAMVIAVPKLSSANIISSEAAYMVFAYGADMPSHTIAPWTKPGNIYTRFWDSGTLEMIGKAIGLPGGKWQNATDKTSMNTASGTPDMQTKLTAAASMDQNSPIGILGAANLGANLKALAFQATGQTCSYYPDSSSTATDKLNVRQGRYDIWGPEHMVTNVDSSGKPVGVNGNTTAVQTVVNALLATSQAPAVVSTSDAGAGDGGVASTLTEDEVGALIDAISVPATGVIPWCAMQVTRSSEVGAESSYSPPAPCGCRFESKASTVAVPGHTCTSCTKDSDCTGTATHCRFNFCEAQ